VRERQEKRRAAKFREVFEDGAFYGQPHSQPVEQGEIDTRLGVGGRRFGTTRKVDGGYCPERRSVFVADEPFSGAIRSSATPAARGRRH
jgi:hypothetical protein